MSNRNAVRSGLKVGEEFRLARAGFRFPELALLHLEEVFAIEPRADGHRRSLEPEREPARGAEQQCLRDWLARDAILRQRRSGTEREGVRLRQPQYGKLRAGLQLVVEQPPRGQPILAPRFE